MILKIQDIQENIEKKIYGKEDLNLKEPLVQNLIKQTYHEDYIDNFDEWALYSNPKILKSVTDHIIKMMEEQWSNYEFLASLGSSGSPLTYSLSLGCNKKSIYINDDWGITPLFQPLKPSELRTDLDKFNILLVDSVYKSGITAYNGVKTIKKYGLEKDLDIHCDILVISLLTDFIEKDMFNQRYFDSNIYFVYFWNDKVKELAKNEGII